MTKIVPPGVGMSTPYLAFVFFIYGLAFFIMGVAILLEGGRGSDTRLRVALRWLAIFGFLHGTHEWIEMFQVLELLPLLPAAEAMRLGLLAISFLALSCFGATLLPTSPRLRRPELALPLSQVGLWLVGLLLIGQAWPAATDFWPAAEGWTRYILAVPAALLASIGLVAQQYEFRQAGLVRFGQDSLWAALAFAVYGLVGQTFTHASLLPPTDVLNHALFERLFGFPIQLLRAGAAGMAAVFVIRFLRAFDVEMQRQIAALQAARVEAAERREAWRGEMLRRVVAAQEAERQRIARELHDATGQALTALGLGLRAVSTAMRTDQDRAATELRQLEKMTADSLDELRQLIADLRPSHLDDLGLASTLRWYAKQVQARTALAVQVEVQGEERALAPAARIAFFRVIQEALTNVVKHSGAQAARVRLNYGADGVSVEIEDDGRGFAQNGTAVDARPAWGLLGMEERAALLGGHFQVHSAPGAGTRVSVTIPYPNAEETPA